MLAAPQARSHCRDCRRCSLDWKCGRPRESAVVHKAGAGQPEWSVVLVTLESETSAPGLSTGVSSAAWIVGVAR